METLRHKNTFIYIPFILFESQRFVCKTQNSCRFSISQTENIMNIDNILKLVYWKLVVGHLEKSCDDYTSFISTPHSLMRRFWIPSTAFCNTQTIIATPFSYHVPPNTYSCSTSVLTARYPPFSFTQWQLQITVSIQSLTCSASVNDSANDVVMNVLAVTINIAMGLAIRD